jgi:hypothetical protein
MPVGRTNMKLYRINLVNSLKVLRVNIFSPLHGMNHSLRREEEAEEEPQRDGGWHSRVLFREAEFNGAAEHAALFRR